MKTTNIIIGSSGFIGSNLKKYFKKKNIEAIGLSSKNLNLLNKNNVKSFFKNYNKSFNIIICSSITRSKEDTVKSYTDNIKMINNLSVILNNSFLNKVIFLSTTDVYKKSSYKINEKSKLGSTTYYGKSKIKSEEILFNKSLKFKFQLIILRLPGIYGPNDKNKSTIGVLVNNAIKNKNITINNRGKDKRDYVYIDDLSYIISKLIKQKFSGILNIATGNSNSINEITEIISQKIKFNITYKNNSNSFIEHKKYNIKKLRNLLPDLELINIKSGILKYINYSKKK